MYLLDTNVISERLKPKPDANVVAWLDEVGMAFQYISVLTLGEIRHGIERMDIGKRKIKLTSWLEHSVPEQFEDRILAVDNEVADCWGILIAQNNQMHSVVDSLIAATAIVHGLEVVTRNVRHFTHFGVNIFNPWQSV